jgi:hypothetical protein
MVFERSGGQVWRRALDIDPKCGTALLAQDGGPKRWRNGVRQLSCGPNDVATLEKAA